jgi:uncharacterized protein
MPTNYDYAYARALQQYEEAKTLEEKITGLEAMRSTAPSHKGAENLRQDITGRLAKFKGQLEKSKQKKGKSSGMTAKKETAVQIILVGVPNSGKSTLLKTLTNANPQIANYKFTTTEPEIGIIEYKKGKMQIVEIPGIIKGTAKGKARGKEKLNLIRNSDFVIFVLRGKKHQIKSEIDLIVEEMRQNNVKINIKKPDIILKKNDTRGIEIAGEQNLLTEKEKVISYLNSIGVVNGTLAVNEKADLEKIKVGLDPSTSYNKGMGLWLNGEESFNYKNIEIEKINLEKIEEIKEMIYNKLDLIFVFTKKNREKKIDEEPILLKKDSTVEDLCKTLHKDFIQKFKYAKVTGSTKFVNQKVSKDYILKDKDLVEIFI